MCCCGEDDSDPGKIIESSKNDIPEDKTRPCLKTERKTTSNVAENSRKIKTGIGIYCCEGY